MDAVQKAFGEYMDATSDLYDANSRMGEASRALLAVMRQTPDQHVIVNYLGKRYQLNKDLSYRELADGRPS